jgi:colanic acid/amylovoran biosynthesis glycosyltransferase
MTEPLRVLMVTGAFPLASETFIREQAVELVEEGVDLEILALRPGDGTWGRRDLAVDLASRTRTANIDRPRGQRLLGGVPRLLRLASSAPVVAARAISPRLGWRAMSGQLLEIAHALGGPRRYDAIHCQFGPMGRIMLPVIDAGIVQGPLSVAYYGYDITRELKKHGMHVYDELFARASVLLPNSRYLGECLVAAGAPPEKVRLHRLGIRLEDFQPVDRDGRTGTPVALAVGRFVEKKGFEHLIRAVAIAGDRSAFRVRLVGDGELRPGLEASARELGVEDRIEFVGWLSNREVGGAMRDADLFVAPSVTAADGDMEGMPLVIAEAMATGLPVIGSRHSGIPEAVREGENGVLIEERDDEALAAALIRFSDPAIRLEAGRRSRGIVEADFNSSTQGARLASVLREVAGKGNGVHMDDSVFGKIPT